MQTQEKPAIEKQPKTEKRLLHGGARGEGSWGNTSGRFHIQ